MAAFALSYFDLTRTNIRHIYSDRKPHIFVASPRPFKKSTLLFDVPLVRRFPPRFYDYYPSFNVGLPRAPAFNRMTLTQIREMVERVGKPTAAQKIWQEQVQDENERSKKVKVVRFRSPVHDGGAGGSSDGKAVETSSTPTNEGQGQGQGSDDKAEAKKSDASTKPQKKDAAKQAKPDEVRKVEGGQAKDKDSTEVKVKSENTSKPPPEEKSSKRSSEAKKSEKDGKKIKDETKEKAKDTEVKESSEVKGEEVKTEDEENSADGTKRKKRKSKREKVKENFSKLSLLPPISRRGLSKQQQQQQKQQNHQQQQDSEPNQK